MINIELLMMSRKMTEFSNEWLGFLVFIVIRKITNLIIEL